MKRTPEEQAAYTGRRIEKTGELIQKRAARAMTKGNKFDRFGKASMRLPSGGRLTVEDNEYEKSAVHFPASEYGRDYDGVGKKTEGKGFEVGRARNFKEASIKPGKTEVQLVDRTTAPSPKTYDTLPDVTKRAMAAKALWSLRTGVNEATGVIHTEFEETTRQSEQAMREQADATLQLGIDTQVTADMAVAKQAAIDIERQEAVQDRFADLV